MVSMEAYCALGVLLTSKGQPELALSILDKFMQENPQRAQAHSGRGVALLALGRHEEALIAHDEAIRLDPQSASAHYYKAEALAKLGRTDEALKGCNEALRFNPHYASAFSWKGALLGKLGQYEVALQAIDEAIQLDTQSARDYCNRGIVLIGLKRYKEAFCALNEAIYLDSNMGEALLAKGGVLYSLKQYQEALKTFDRALQLCPDDVYALRTKGEILDILDKHEEALVAYDQTLQIDPCNGGVHHDRGMILRKLDRYEEAVMAFDEALRIKPQAAYIHHEKAVTFVKLSRYEEALRCVDEAIGLNASYASAYGTKGSILSALGRHEEAGIAFDEALRLDPNVPDAAEEQKKGLQMIAKTSGLLGSLEDVFPVQIVGDGVLRNEQGEALEGTQDYLSGGIYILGGNRSERVCLLTDIIRLQAQKDEPIVVFDSCGDLVDMIIQYLPAQCIDKTYLLDLTDRDFPLSLNIFSSIYARKKENRELFSKFLTKWFSRLWPEIDEYLYLRNLLHSVIATLGENQTISLVDVPRFLLDPAFRENVVKGLSDRRIQDFWMREYGNSDNKKSMEDLFLQRIRKMLHESLIELCLCQPGRCLNLPAAIGNKEILLVKLPVDKYEFADTAKMIGGLLLTLVQCMASFSSDRQNATAVLDEFQHFCTDDFERLFTQQESNVKLIYAQQRGDTLHNELGLPKKSVLLSARTVVSFRAAPDDAVELARKVFSGVRRRGTNIESKVLEHLHKHPHPVVKEFYLHSVSKMQAASKIPPRKDEGGPRYDFGFGEVKFESLEVSKLLEQLNTLLYYAQKESDTQSRAAEWDDFMNAYLQLVGAVKYEAFEQEEVVRALEEWEELQEEIRKKIYDEQEKAEAECERLKEELKSIEKDIKDADEKENLFRNDWRKVAGAGEALQKCNRFNLKERKRLTECAQLEKTFSENRDLCIKVKKGLREKHSKIRGKIESFNIHPQEESIYKRYDTSTISEIIQDLKSKRYTYDYAYHGKEALEELLYQVVSALIADPIASDSNESLEGYLKELPKNHAYIKVGETTTFMKLNTLPEATSGQELEERRQQIITQSRKRYARPRQEVEEEIAAAFQ